MDKQVIKSLTNGRCVRALILALATATAACASRSTVPPYQPVAAPTPAPVFTRNAPPPYYRIQSGDDLQVSFPFHDSLNTSPNVRPDGRVTIPGLGDFYAVGMTTEELEADIKGRAAITYREPLVSVTVTKSTENRVYVGGEVGRPGFVALRPGMTALRAITERGGFVMGSETRKVVLIKWQTDGSYSANQLDLREVLETGNTEQDLALGPNDVVYVPPTGIANATAWVQQYIRDLIPVREPTLRGPDVLR